MSAAHPSTLVLVIPPPSHKKYFNPLKPAPPPSPVQGRDAPYTPIAEVPLNILTSERPVAEPLVFNHRMPSFTKKIRTNPARKIPATTSAKPHPSIIVRDPRWSLFRKSFEWSLPRRRASSVDGGVSPTCTETYGPLELTYHFTPGADEGTENWGASPKTPASGTEDGAGRYRDDRVEGLPFSTSCSSTSSQGRDLESFSDSGRWNPSVSFSSREKKVCEPHPGRRIDVGDRGEHNAYVTNEEDEDIPDAKDLSPAHEHREFLKESVPNSSPVLMVERSPAQARVETRGAGTKEADNRFESDMFIFSAGPDVAWRHRPSRQSTHACAPHDGAGAMEDRSPSLPQTQIQLQEPASFRGVAPLSRRPSLAFTPPFTRKNSSSSTSSNSTSSVETCITRIRESFAFRRSTSFQKHKPGYNMFKNEAETGWALCDGEVLESSLGTRQDNLGR